MRNTTKWLLGILVLVGLGSTVFYMGDDKVNAAFSSALKPMPATASCGATFAKVFEGNVSVGSDAPADGVYSITATKPTTAVALDNLLQQGCSFKVTAADKLSNRQPSTKSFDCALAKTYYSMGDVSQPSFTCYSAAANESLTIAFPGEQTFTYLPVQDPLSPFTLSIFAKK